MTSISSNLAESLRRSYETGEYADLNILCGGETIPVHQLIVCSQSEVLRAACLDKDGNRVPGATIDLEHEEIDFVKIMIWFLYFTTYRLREHDVDEDTEDDSDEDIYEVWDMELHASMYVMANKYGIQALRHIARQRFEEAIDQSWNVEYFLNSVPVVFGMMPETDRGLRELVVSHGSAHLRDIMLDVQSRARLQELFHSHPAFAWEVFERNLDVPESETKEIAAIATPSSTEDSVDHTTQFFEEMELCICDLSPDGFRHLAENYRVYTNPQGLEYRAPLFQTNTATEENCFCWIQVITPIYPCPQHPERWYFWTMSGEVGTVAQTHVDTSGDATLDAAIKRFENLKTCSKDYWNFRKTLSQNGQYMYLEQNYEGMWLKQWPSRTIKENAALVDRSTYRKKNVMGG